jgi:Mg-chelatase subunit ChlD
VKRFIFFFIACLLFPDMKAQLLADKLEHDYGNIEHFNNDTAFFVFTNTGTRTIYLLQTQPKDDYAILCDTKTIAPGEQMQLGIIYYTGKKGRFNLDVPLNFSHLNTPIHLKISGNIKSITETAFTTCPSIENTSPLKPSQSPLSVIVREAGTNRQLNDARVRVSKKNITFNCVPGFNRMAYQCKCDYGKLEVKAEKDGYIPASMHFDYDAVNNTCIIYLDRKPAETKKDSIPQRIAEKEIIPEEEQVIYRPVEPQETGFNEKRYKPNHLVFIVDISGSMKDTFKLNYMKQVMKQLLTEIRPQDYVTLITYASKVKVVFENVGGNSKQEIIRALDTLSAKGGSNGAKSITTAYDIANAHFITGGNNQIFLATDGLFNSNSISDEELFRIARKEYNKSKIIFSTIGFGHDAKALDFLGKMAKNGKGNFLTINSLPGDIMVLLEEVKKQSEIR